MNIIVMVGTQDPTSDLMEACASSDAFVIVQVLDHTSSAADGTQITVATTDGDPPQYPSSGAHATSGGGGVTLQFALGSGESYPLDRTLNITAGGQRFSFSLTIDSGVQIVQVVLLALEIEELGLYADTEPTVVGTGIDTDVLYGSSWEPIPGGQIGNRRLYVNCDGPNAQVAGQDYDRTGSYIVLRARLRGPPGEIANRTVRWSYNTVTRLAHTGNIFDQVRGVVDTRARPCFYKNAFSYPDTLDSTTDDRGYTGKVYFYPSGSGGDTYTISASVAAPQQLSTTTPNYTVYRRITYYAAGLAGQQFPAHAALQSLFTPVAVDLQRIGDQRSAQLDLSVSGYDEGSRDFHVVYSNLQSTTFDDDWNYRLIFRARGGNPTGWLRRVEYRVHGGGLNWTTLLTGAAARNAEGSVVRLLPCQLPNFVRTPAETQVLNNPQYYLHPAIVSKDPVIEDGCDQPAAFNVNYVQVPRLPRHHRNEFQKIDCQAMADVGFPLREVVGNSQQTAAYVLATTVAGQQVNGRRLRITDTALRRSFYIDLASTSLQPTAMQAYDLRITYRAARYFSGDASQGPRRADVSSAFIAVNVGATAAPEVVCAALAHEIGHIHGAVTTGVPNHTAEGAGGHHCTDPTCVMYWSTMSGYNKAFCADCTTYWKLANLRKVRKVTAQS